MAGTTQYYSPNFEQRTIPNYYIPPQQQFNTVPNLPQQPQNSILTVFVNSEEEVNFYPVAAGVTVMLVSFNLGKFYLKSTGKNGVPEPLRVFNFSEEAHAAQNQNETKFVSQEDFDALSKKLDTLIKSLGGDK
jgi:hypothetical protein